MSARGSSGSSRVAARRDLVDEVRVRGEQDGLGELVVLGLGEEVHRDPVRVRVAVADHDDLRGSRHHVDADHPEHAPLRGGDVGVAGADDLVHLRHALRTVGERTDRLRAADGVDPVDAAERGRCQHQLVLFAAGRRHHHDHFPDPRDLGRNAVHEHGRRVGRTPAGHVETDAVERRDALAELRAVRFAVAPGILQLAAVKGADTLRSLLERAALGRGEPLEGALETLGRHLERAHGRRFQMIEATRVVEHGSIPAALHVGEDLGNRRLDPRVLGRFEGEQRREARLKVRLRGGQASRRRHGDPGRALRRPGQRRRRAAGCDRGGA